MFDEVLDVGCLRRRWRWGAGGGVFDKVLEAGCLTRRWRWGC